MAGKKINKGKGASAPPQEKNPAAPLSKAEQEIDLALAQSAVQNIRKKERKKNFNRALMFVGVGVLVYLGYYLFTPFKGDMKFGICKVFLELNVDYPQDLHLSEVVDLGNSVRIWYSRLDPFGEYRMEAIQCHYKTDPNAGMIFEKVTINRRDVDQPIIDRFNISIPMIFAYPPDLSLPYDFPDNISDLQFQTDMFRKKLF